MWRRHLARAVYTVNKFLPNYLRAPSSSKEGALRPSLGRDGAKFAVEFQTSSFTESMVIAGCFKGEQFKLDSTSSLT